MTPLRFFLICALLSCYALSHAEIPCKPNFTAEQSKHEINRLTTGSDQRILKTYKEGVLFSEEWHQDWPIRYMKYFYPNGILKSEGLMDNYKNVGTWHYYDTNGILIKTADYSTITLQFAKGYSEKQIKLLNRMSMKADSFILGKYGQRFIESNKVVCDHKYYSTTDPYDSREWMDIPEGTPYEFTFSYTMSVHDSLEFNLLYFDISADGSITADLWGMPPGVDSSGKCMFNVMYDDAVRIAQAYPFADSLIPKLRYSESGYYWNFYGPSTGTPNRYTYSVLSIDAITAKADTFRETSLCDHCEPVVYKKYYKDTSVIAPGYKIIYGDGIYLNVPETWIELEDYGKTSSYSKAKMWFGEGDTLRMRNTYGREDRLIPIKYAAIDYDERVWRTHPNYRHMPFKMGCAVPLNGTPEERAKRIACQREADSTYSADSLRVVHYNDSIRSDYEAKVAHDKSIQDSIRAAANRRQLLASRKQDVEDSLCSAFVGSFPDCLMQGRHVQLFVSLPDEYNPYWSIEMEVNNAHGGYGVGQTNYHFTADHLSEAQFYRMYAILKTARFLSYK